MLILILIPTLGLTSTFMLMDMDIDTNININVTISEVIMDFQRCFPTDVQRYPPTDLHVSVIFSDGPSLVSCMFQRIVTSPVDVHWNSPTDVQWHVPMEFSFCDFWRVISCPDHSPPPPARSPVPHFEANAGASLERCSHQRHWGSAAHHLAWYRAARCKAV